MLKSILLTTDGSELSKLAIAAALKLAATHGSHIVGFAVAETFPHLVMPGMGATFDLNSIQQEIMQNAQTAADYIAESAAAAGVTCEIHVTQGAHPYEEILKAAETYQCDTIFMASHGRKGVDRLFLGSETQKVLAHSTLPVLVFK